MSNALIAHSICRLKILPRGERLSADAGAPSAAAHGAGAGEAVDVRRGSTPWLRISRVSWRAIEVCGRRPVTPIITSTCACLFLIWELRAGAGITPGACTLRG
eukprot:6874377-Pyramimonas_sp.AAC.1